MKFGGTSVEDIAAFERAAEIVSHERSRHPVVAVVSAMGGFTDALVRSTREATAGELEKANATIAPHFARHLDVVERIGSDERDSLRAIIQQAREDIARLLTAIVVQCRNRPALVDSVLAYGEQLSSLLLAAMLRRSGVIAEHVDARRCVITNDEHGCASPLIGETMRSSRDVLVPFVQHGIVPVMGGFIASTLAGKTTTIGRGGSDYTAALVGSALSAGEIQIWTDVSGVLTADPRVVPAAYTIPRLSFAEAAELAYFGAKVLHPKTIQPAVEKDIPVRICNSRLREAAGTLVCGSSETALHAVKAIAHKTGVTTVQVSSARMLGAYGFLKALFEVFDRHRTIVDVVTTSEVSVSLSVDDTSALPAIVEELAQLGTVSIESDRAIICVVGEGLRGTPGIAARVFNTISDINVTLISQGASSINLTFAIEQAHVQEAVTRLHETFFEQSSTRHIAAGD
jgi:aspartate kinase